MNNEYNRRRQEDWLKTTPPHSRLFLVCSKVVTVKELEEAFSPFGIIENVHIPRNRTTGASKGIAYIKYTKTSEAAHAMEEMDRKCVGVEEKPIKVVVASEGNEDNTENEERYKRLFIVCSKTATQSELREYFSTFGKVNSITLLKDKLTNECKGFAYISFMSFRGAACAFEDCDRKYKAIFAQPRESLKRNRTCFESNSNSIATRQIGKDNFQSVSNDNVCSLIKATPNNFVRVNVLCSPSLTKHHIVKLFNIVPGMQNCTYTVDSHSDFGKAYITYESPAAAAHAVQRLHNFEYPIGQKIIVEPDNNILNKVANDLTSVVNNFKDAMGSGNSIPNLAQLVDAMSQASSLIKSAACGPNMVSQQKRDGNDGYDALYCSVPLPEIQPLADEQSPTAKRCFVVCKPHPPPPRVLCDVFCRFGDLINIYMLPNKSFGFARYASADAANAAINTLHGATVTGIMLKVLEAEEKKNEDIDQGKKRKPNTDPE